MMANQQPIEFNIDVRHNIMEQFAEQLGVSILHNEARLDTTIGKGIIQL